jgi:hypothetical protein
LIDNSVPINSANADFLYNTVNNSLYYRNRETSQWVQISGGVPGPSPTPDPDPDPDTGGPSPEQPPAPSYLTTTDAALIYLSKNSASVIYLTKSSASVQFNLQTQSLNSASTYIVSNYAPINNPYFYGVVNFASASIVGLAPYLADDILPSQPGNQDKILSTNGTNSFWSDKPIEPFLLMGS